MNNQEAIKSLKNILEYWTYKPTEVETAKLAISALEKQITKKVYHFLEDDTFIATCCGIDVSNKDYEYCPECGQLLGEVEEVEPGDEYDGKVEYEEAMMDTFDVCDICDNDQLDTCPYIENDDRGRCPEYGGEEPNE